MADLPLGVWINQAELHILVNVLQDQLAYAVYVLLKTHCTFDTGEVPATVYARLMALLTPPRPERGRRRPSPTYEQLRRVMRDLEACSLVRRDPVANAAQGQLRTFLPHVAHEAAERKKKLAQAQRPQGLTQGTKARKAA